LSWSSKSIDLGDRPGAAPGRRFISDALIGALAVHGDATAIARSVTAHLDAGADHVAVQVLNPELRDCPEPSTVSLLAPR
jgi:hypothetical protein